MKVVSRIKVLVNSLKDYYVKDLVGSVSYYDVERVFDINDNTVHTWFSINGDCIDIVVELFNESVGSDLGTRLYSIPLFSDNEKERIRFNDENFVLGIIELLQQYGVGFNELGNGLISDSILNDEETQKIKLWFSNDFKYLSISRKFLEQKQIQISKETILDSLGL